MAGIWAIRLASALASLMRIGFRILLSAALLITIDFIFGTSLGLRLLDYVSYPLTLPEIMFSGEERADNITAFFTAMAVAASVILGSIQVYQSNKVARATKTIDVIMHAAVRYNELNKSRPAARARSKTSLEDRGKEIHTWHNTYWGLKNDQFDYWLMGFFDHDTFCDWSSSIYKYFWRDAKDIDLSRHPDLLLGRIDYKSVKESYPDSWMRYRNSVNGAVNPRFVGFIDSLAENVQFYSQIVSNRGKEKLAGNEMEKIWDLLFAEMIGLVYTKYIDKPGFILRLWHSYLNFEIMILRIFGIDDLFSPMVKSGFGDRWRRDTIRGMTWQRYTQTLKDNPKFRNPVYRSLMKGQRDTLAIESELFGTSVERGITSWPNRGKANRLGSPRSARGRPPDRP